MYDFHYNYIKIKFDAQLLFTETGSLAYKIKTGNVYEDFYEDKYLFDCKENKAAKGVNKHVVKHKS